MDLEEARRRYLRLARISPEGRRGYTPGAGFPGRVRACSGEGPGKGPEAIALFRYPLAALFLLLGLPMARPGYRPLVRR